MFIIVGACFTGIFVSMYYADAIAPSDCSSWNGLLNNLFILNGKNLLNLDNKSLNENNQ